MALGTSLGAAWGRGHPGSAVRGCRAGYRSYAGGGNARARNFLGGGPADQNNNKYFWVVLFLCLILTLIRRIKVNVIGRPREGAARWWIVFSRPRDHRAPFDACSRRARAASESDSRSRRREQRECGASTSEWSGYRLAMTRVASTLRDNRDKTEIKRGFPGVC